MTFVRRPEKVEASQWFKLGDHEKVTLLPNGNGVGWLATKYGGYPVQPSSWVVEDQTGNVFVMDDKEFNLTYQEVES